MTLVPAHINNIASFLASVLEGIDSIQNKFGEPVFRDEKGRQVSHRSQAALLYKGYAHWFSGFRKRSYTSHLNSVFLYENKVEAILSGIEAQYLSEGIKVSSIIGLVLLEAGCDIRTKEGYIEFVEQWKEANQSVKSHLDKSARHAFYVLRHAARQFMVENRIT